MSHLCFIKNINIALYHSTGNEVDLSYLRKTDFATDKQYVLPVICDRQNMVFKTHDTSDPLTKNKYEILEPQDGQVIHQTEIELCLLPLVGFNRQGARLGMGGGYYDRYFEYNKSQEKPTILAGIAYDFQENDTITPEPWDVPLDIIFTNKETIEL